MLPLLNFAASAALLPAGSGFYPPSADAAALLKLPCCCTAARLSADFCDEAQDEERAV